MTTSTPELQRTLDRLLAEALRDPRLGPEMARARREFFGVRALPPDDEAQTAAADARFAEWYLLERESDVLGEPPAKSMLREMGTKGQDDTATALLSSMAGVFMVDQGAVVDGDGGEATVTVRIRDLQDGRGHDLALQPHLGLGAGDVVVGRLFDDGGEALLPSAAVAVQPQGQGLAAAFERDVHGLGLDRRLSQAEIEHLLFVPLREAAAAQESQVPLEHLEAQLQRRLDSAGKNTLDATEISHALAETDKPGAVIGPLLDELAFDTDIDLEKTRTLLLAVWNRRAAQAAPPTAAPAEPTDAPPSEAGPVAETLGQRLARRIEDGMSRHEDVEAIFDDVASLMGEDIDDEEALVGDEPDDDEAAGPTDVFSQGDLGALVQEFLWEEDCNRGAEQEVLARLLHDQEQAPVPKVDLEALEAEDVLRFLVRTYLAAPPAIRARRVLQDFGVLERFYGWARRTQEYSLQGTLESCKEAFVDQLERVQAASLALTRQFGRGGCEREPGLLRVVSVDRTAIEVAPCSGDAVAAESEPLRVPAAGNGIDLQPGDLLLGALVAAADAPPTLAGMVVVLPASVEAMLGA